jgi:hypothetical protein
MIFEQGVSDEIKELYDKHLDLKSVFDLIHFDRICECWSTFVTECLVDVSFVPITNFVYLQLI